MNIESSHISHIIVIGVIGGLLLQRSGSVPVMSFVLFLQFTTDGDMQVPNTYTHMRVLLTSWMIIRKHMFLVCETSMSFESCT